MNLAGRIYLRLRSIDPSFWVIAAGILLRIDVALRYDVAFGYDAQQHFKYTDLLATGVVPRVGGAGELWTAQHPPLFYALALAMEALGLGKDGGELISLFSGAARLILGDFFLRRADASPRVRLIGNLIHAFVPVGVRMDVFYSPESLAATLCLAAVMAAVAQRAWFAGALLGLALLSKVTAVTAIPAVGFALAFGNERRLSRANIFRTALAMVVAATLFFSWAHTNVRQFGTPFPNAYRTQKDEGWKLPLFKRHRPSYYRPRLDYSELTYPFYSPPISLPNVLVLDTWGDYYNFLHRKHVYRASRIEAANSKALGPSKLYLHVVLAHLALIFLAVLAAGVVEAARRLYRRKMTTAEMSAAILGLGYITVMIWYAIWVIHEHDGPAKAAYGLGASAVLSLWTARPLASALDHRSLRPFVLALLGVLLAVTLLLRVTW